MKHFIVPNIDGPKFWKRLCDDKPTATAPPMLFPGRSPKRPTCPACIKKLTPPKWWSDRQAAKP
jgi:hypothetical protein